MPKSPGQYFPDFIVELKSGEIVLVAYKGGHLAEATEEKHKREVGELWAARSSGKCRFGYVVDEDWGMLAGVLA